MVTDEGPLASHPTIFTAWRLSRQLQGSAGFGFAVQEGRRGEVKVKKQKVNQVSASYG